MVGTTSSVHNLTAADLMSRDVVTIPSNMSLRAAGKILRRADIGGAPVVNERGCCVGMLSAADLLHAAEEPPHLKQRPIRTCLHQVDGHLANGQEAVICTLSPGGCVLQAMQRTADGTTAPICLMPHDVLCDGQQIHEEDAACDEVSACMTRDVVAVKPDARVSRLVQMMIDAHIHRVVVTDEQDRPVGIVSATDVLAALARETDSTADLDLSKQIEEKEMS